MEKTIMWEGYAPNNLIEELKKAPWVSVVGGRDFAGIDLGPFALTDTKDLHCPTKYQITVHKIPNGPQFQIEGFCYSDLLEQIANDNLPVVFDGICLENRSFDELQSDEDAFRVVINAIS